MNGIARGVGTLEIDGHFLSQTTRSVVHHEGVDSGKRRQVRWREHGHGAVLTRIRPSVEVVVVNPLFPDHGRHAARENRLILDGDLDDLRWTGRPMVVPVHGGINHPGLDGIHGEGPTDVRRANDV